jgi:GDP-L-fucose synthase
MKFNDKIFIAGHKGLVGSAILKELKLQGFTNLITRSKKALNLTNQMDVQNFFDQEKPDLVFLSAAKVGGIYSNSTYPADFIYENIMIQTNVIHAAYKSGAERLLFLGSTCIYPKLAFQPIKEESLLTGPLEETNEPYAVAKIAGLKMCESYNRQFDTDFRSIMPTNLYGKNDNFHSQNSHVIPALINRFHNAKINNQTEVAIWGSGKALREFLYVDDLASAAIFVMKLDKAEYRANTQPMQSHLNVGTGVENSISQVAEEIKRIVEFKGKIKFDKSMPDGTPRKVVEVSKLNSLGWKYSVELCDGLRKTYDWFKKNSVE